MSGATQLIMPPVFPQHFFHPQQGSMIAPQPIIQAVGRGDVEAVRAWLEAGGDASALSERGTALICFAACTSGARMVKLLLTAARPAKAGYADAEGWTALHAAAGSLIKDRSGPAAVAQLCDHGADVNARMFTSLEYDEDGEPYYDEPNPPTPLLCAADYGLSCEIVRVLLSRGADVTATSASGDSAEDYARATLDRPVVASIEDAVAEYDYHSAAQAIQYWDDLDEPWRLEGEVESIIELLADVRSAGSWKHYTGAWRVELLLLQRLCAAGRASPFFPTVGHKLCVCKPSIERLEATSGCKVTPRKNYEDVSGTELRTIKGLMANLIDLPPPLVGKIASYWRTARDPLY
jgi:hypothetical protein